MKILYLVLFVLVVFSCSENKEEPGIGYEFYIKAELDGELVIYAAESSPKSSNGAYYTREGNPDDTNLQIRRMKSNTANSDFIHIQINRIRLDDITTPYNVSQTSDSPKPYFQISIDDTDPDIYYGVSLLGDNINLSILDKENDIISGTFGGELKTQSGQTITVTNGEFRSRIDRIHTN